MKITTTSRHYELTPALKEYAESKIQNLTTYFDNIVSAHIIFALEKYRHLVEVTLHVNGRDIVGHETSEDMYTSVDRVAEKLERQLIKHKGKLYKKKPKKRTPREAHLPPEQPTESQTSVENEIIPADPIEFQKMTMEEAVSLLAENGKGFSIFSNRITNRLNVLYRREDGTIGIIEA
ncbi:MAG: ribosome-associated translation inhibitor RaiA [Candidatus Krumholzibacteria bacterium]|nr:ribosome-associated translation inhibitor RaiA [Candidatus Krumholzibacteria bacterium]